MLPRLSALAPPCALLAAIALSSASSCVLITEIDYDLIPDATKDGGNDAGPAPECTADAGCDDQDSCTTDTCVAGQCSHTSLAVGATCAPDAPCTSTFACDAQGACVPSPIVVDDSDACTADLCDTQTGAITHEPLGSGCISWVAVPEQNAPSPRQNHTVVWTGSKMIVWGGETTGPTPILGDGAAYDPVTRAWTPVNMQGAPSGRFGHRAVWTGSRMIVWGGYAANGLATGGGLYDPMNDTWYPLSTAGEPSGRLLHSAVWTGSKMIVWGGLAGNAVKNSGGIYDPKTNNWQATPIPGSPSYRFSHSATWAGDKMIVWGGYDLFDWMNDGAMLNALGNGWSGPTSMANAPAMRESHSALWTGTELIVWGGWNGGPYLDTGGMFDPAAGKWTTTSNVGAPSARSKHVALWTGMEMLIWGGCGGDLCGTFYGDGGRFTPSASGGSWQTVPAVSTLGARQGATGVWTGSRVIIWGGRDAQGPLGTGAEAQL